MEANFIIDQFGTLSFVGITGMMFVANLFPGIPEEFFIMGLGYLAGRGLVDYWVVFVLTFPVLVLLDSTLFYLSKYGNKYLVKIARFILGRDISSSNSFIRDHIVKILIASRFVFQVRFLGPYLAGVIGIKFKKFLVVNILTLAVYIPFMLFMGSYFEARIGKIFDGIGVLRNIIFVSLVFVVGVFLVFRLRKSFIRNIKTRVNGIRETVMPSFSKTEKPIKIKKKIF